MATAPSSTLDLNQSLFREPPSSWRGGKTAARGFAVSHIHVATNVAHRIDHLVGGNREVDAGHRHLDRRQGNRGSCRVAKDAWQLYETPERITDQAERSLLGEGYRLNNLARRCTEHLGTSTGSHSRGCSCLGLTPALSARQ